MWQVAENLLRKKNFFADRCMGLSQANTIEFSKDVLIRIKFRSKQIEYETSSCSRCRLRVLPYSDQEAPFISRIFLKGH
jgi:hypothetical protein